MHICVHKFVCIYIHIYMHSYVCIMHLHARRTRLAKQSPMCAHRSHGTLGAGHGAWREWSRHARALSLSNTRCIARAKGGLYDDTFLPLSLLGHCTGFQTGKSGTTLCRLPPPPRASRAIPTPASSPPRREHQRANDSEFRPLTRAYTWRARVQAPLSCRWSAVACASTRNASAKTWQYFTRRHGNPPPGLHPCIVLSIRIRIRIRIC